MKQNKETDIRIFPLGTLDEDLVSVAVVFAKYQKKWILCKHKDRDTFECPGGHRENKESMEETASRELYEETGAKNFKLIPVCYFSQCINQAAGNREMQYGKVYCAEVDEMGALPRLEIEQTILVETLAAEWTYPEFQEKLIPLILKISS